MPRSRRVVSVALLTCAFVLTGCSNEGSSTSAPAWSSTSSTPAVSPSAAGSGPSGAATSPSTTSGIVTGRTGTFTVTAPAGWTEASSQVGSVQGLETVLVAGEQTSSFSNNLVVVSVAGDEQTAKDELAKGRDALKGEGRALTEVPDQQVGGVRASGFGATFEKQGVKVLARSWAVPHLGRVYLLTLSSSQADADHALGQLGQILRSWQWR
jgi:hypothetical protein